MKKLTHEYVYNYYASEEYHMCNIYNSNRNNDELICPVGHKIKMCFSNFKQGKRCIECSKSKKHSHDYIFNYYYNEKYIMHNIYNGNRNNDQLTCPKGHNIKMTFDNFQQGKRCQKCHFNNNFGENHPRWKSERTRKRRTNSLQFDLNKINILKDDPNFNKYLKLHEESNIERTKGNIHHKTEMTVDHIHPRIAFIDNNLDNIYGKKVCQKIVNKRNNLRIISSKNNRSKGGMYNQEEFIKWFENQLILELMNI